MVALAPNHPLATRRTVRLADLRDEDWTAALSDGVIVRTCRAAGFEPRLVSITRDQLAIRALVIRGLAVTLVPELLADPFRDLALRPIADSEVARDVFAVLPPGALHPLLPDTLAALDAVATDLTRKRPGDPRRSTGSRNNEAGPADPRARPRSARPPDAQQR